MGTFVTIQAVADSQRQGAAAVEAAFSEIQRIEQRISEWKSGSDISAVNRAAGEDPVAVGPDLHAVVNLALHISELTKGAFDISFAACGALWSFRPPRIPAEHDLELCLDLVDYRRIVIEVTDNVSRIGLRTPGMSIGVGGIGKGYAVDKAARVLEEHGIESYIVDGGGDIRLRGQHPDRPWTLAIAHPRQKGHLYGSFSPDDGAVVTSGDYESNFVRDGILYHHILDPQQHGSWDDGTSTRDCDAWTLPSPQPSQYA